MKERYFIPCICCFASCLLIDNSVSVSFTTPDVPNGLNTLNAATKQNIQLCCVPFFAFFNFHLTRDQNISISINVRINKYMLLT